MVALVQGGKLVSSTGGFALPMAKKKRKILHSVNRLWFAGGVTATDTFEHASAACDLLQFFAQRVFEFVETHGERVEVVYWDGTSPECINNFIASLWAEILIFSNLQPKLLQNSSRFSRSCRTLGPSLAIRIHVSIDVQHSLDVGEDPRIRIRGSAIALANAVEVSFRPTGTGIH